MSNQTIMDSGSRSGLYKWVAILLAALLAILTFMGYGPGGSNCKPAAAVATAPVEAPAVVATPAPAPAPAPVVAATPAPAPAADTKPLALPEAKVYFALDKTDLPKDVDTALAEVVTYLKTNAGSKASISGFHDPSGNKQHNEDLALNRARNVRDALEKMGIAKERLTMQKPAETTGTGDPRHARRVDVTIEKS
jgi:K(+)-stimulated pyrophosphate-energized sodium pump